MLINSPSVFASSSTHFSSQPHGDRSLNTQMYIERFVVSAQQLARESSQVELHSKIGTLKCSIVQFIHRLFCYLKASSTTFSVYSMSTINYSSLSHRERRGAGPGQPPCRKGVAHVSLFHIQKIIRLRIPGIIARNSINHSETRTRCVKIIKCHDLMHLCKTHINVHMHKI